MRTETGHRFFSFYSSLFAFLFTLALVFEFIFTVKEKWGLKGKWKHFTCKMPLGPHALSRERASPLQLKVYEKGTTFLTKPFLPHSKVSCKSVRCKGRLHCISAGAEIKNQNWEQSFSCPKAWWTWTLAVTSPTPSPNCCSLMFSYDCVKRNTGVWAGKINLPKRFSSYSLFFYFFLNKCLLVNGPARLLQFVENACAQPKSFSISPWLAKLH